MGRRRSDAGHPRVARVGVTLLFTEKAAEVVGFYRAIGLRLEEESHDGGPSHWACDVRGFHFAVFGASRTNARRRPVAHRGPGATMIGVYVDSLDAAVRAVRSRRARLLRGPEKRPWGRRIVVLDPDGRGVEITQAP